MQVRILVRTFSVQVFWFRSKADAKEILKSSGASCDEIPSGGASSVALLLTWHQKEMPGCFLTGTWIEGAREREDASSPKCWLELKNIAS